ncbi:Carbohydrate-binding family 9 [Mucilaginibacter pineti]|uniref:Carbohydrate-binding family 9 n=1 Tax=Mucilaginibacter pineti TaxID=1391627 RepID=A0A1G6X3V9_9SPHI|nr:carbohydrate-binding family 9-like protein [Mucilaginibacter pineti]SDD72107.1 Carbohydrate-binding family 9 [Mucilaginibacter pineti]
MSKKLEAQYIPAAFKKEGLSELSSALDLQPNHKLDNLLWSSNGYFPEADFSIAYTDESILLKYFVKEKHIRAVYTQVNDLVYQDSCVELFITFNNIGYYNIEFNCAGTPYAAYGPDKQNRVLLPVNVVQEIGILSAIQQPNNDGLIAWELTLQIPLSVFIHDDITRLKGTECRANFYKCGDELPQPHYLSWNNILSNQPNFHVPEFFGSLAFN